MDGRDMDTDTLLALLSSLLHPQEFEEAVLLEALANSNGSIEDAARSLLAPEPPRKRRKVSGKISIDSWLKGSDSPVAAEGSPSSRSQSTTKERSKPLDRGRRSVSPPKGAGREATRDEGPRSTAKPASKVKNVTGTELMALLRPPNSTEGASSKLQLPRLPPLTLTTAEMVAEHTPCTLHNSVLPSELACRLYYTLLHASREWERIKWWVADRVVESSHSSTFFKRAPDQTYQGEDAGIDEAANHWYNRDGTSAPPTFPPAMEEACQIIEQVVNAEMRKRKRYPLEWGGYPAKQGEEPLLWRANVAASNCYAGAKEAVGFHSDQLTHLGPYPTIASLSLGVSRIFRLREVVPLDERDKRAARTFNIPLRHNSLIIMHASTQEMFKHAVPPQSSIDMFRPPFPPPSLSNDKQVLARLQEASNARINVTFRFYRPDFGSKTSPKCKCGAACILRPDMKNRYTDVSPAPVAPCTDNNPLTDSLRYSSVTPGSSSGRRDMVAKYWWTCYAGAQNEGKGCGYWKVMDVKAEGRGPFVGDAAAREASVSR